MFDVKGAKNPLTVIAIAAMIILPLPVVTFDPFTMFILILALLWAVVAVYLNLLIGYGGIFFISPMIFVGIAGFTSAWTSLAPDAKYCPVSGCLGLHPFLSIMIGVAFAVIASFIFSLLSTRLKGYYMALFSLLFTLLLATIHIQYHPALDYWMGAAIGLLELPDIVVGGFEFRSLGGIAYYYLQLGILIIGLVVLRLFLRSNLGLASRTLRDNEEYSKTLGVNPVRFRIYSFMLAALFMGVSGGVWVHFISAIGGINSSPFSLQSILIFLAAVFVGGIGTVLGPVVGIFIIIFLDENLKLGFGAWRWIIIGATLLAVVLVAPEGIVGKIQKRLSRNHETVFPTYKVSLKRSK